MDKEQTLTDKEQTLTDKDQTLTDKEQTLDNTITNKKVNKKKYFIYNCDESENIKLYEEFFYKIKPIEGVITYKIINWLLFPKTLEESKKISREWSKNFMKQKKYKDYEVLIYFHTEYNTIRFELIKINKLDDILMIEDFENNVLLNINEITKTKIYNINKINKFPDLEQCKELGRKWALILEEKFSDKKFIILLNYFNKNITIKLL